MKRKFTDSRGYTNVSYGAVIPVGPPLKRRKTTKRKIVIPRQLQGYVRTSGSYGRYAKDGELKFYEQSWSGTFSTTGAILESKYLNGIGQGTTENERVGRKCVIKKIHIQGYMYTQSQYNSDYIRMMLVLDKQCNGGLPAVTEFLTSNSLTSFNNLANNQRFTILKDWKFPMNVGGVTTNFDANTRYFAQNVKTIRFNKSVSIPLEFGGTEGAITELKSNNLFLYGINLVNSNTTMVLRSRIRFSDN